MIDFQVKVNATELRDRFRRLKDDVQIKVVDAALRQAAQVFRRAVIAKAPVLKKASKGRVAGTLQKAIYTARSKYSTSGARRYFIGVRSGTKAGKSGRDAFYWRWLEAGWMPRGPGQALKGGTRRRNLQRRRNAAAGNKTVEFPFIKPAFDASKGAAEQKFRVVFAREFEKASKP